MWKFKVFFVSIIVAALIYSSQSVELPKPSYTRTILKVSRSLPGETEELKVRTSEGNVATLIVKRREKSPSPSANESVATEPSKVSQEQPVIVEQRDDINGSSSKQEEIKRRENAQIEEIKAKLSKYRDDSIEKKDSIDYGTWKPLGLVRVSEIAATPTTEEYLSWKPLTPLESKPIEDARINYDRWRKDDFFNPSSTLANSQDGSRKASEAENRSSKSVPYSFLPHESRPSTRTNIGANLSINRNAKNVPPEVVIQSELNVKLQPKRSAMSVDADGTPVIHGQRVPDEPIDQVQVWRNARVINNKLIQGDQSFTTIASPQPDPSTTHPSADKFVQKQKFDKFFDDVNRRFGRNFEDQSRNFYFEWDPKNYQNEALKAEVYEFRNDQFNPRSNLHKRMLHPDSYATYPDSRLYTTEAYRIAPVALKPGARAPVLQYAHPELGVQPAKILKNERRKPDNFPENQHSFTEQRHKKKYVLNDKNIIDTYNTKDYYPNQHFYGLKRPQDPPLWIKISENIKNQLSTGVEKVSEFTRPVFDPLVEATHKISKNLGLSRDNDNKVAEDKIGTVATAGSSMLLPALGWVASGAALGIGAVAVGRYLDVDVLKRSNDAAELRNLSPDQLYVMETETPMPRVTDELVIEDPKQRNKRSLDGSDSDFTNAVRDQRLYQRKGADSISEIVEIDLPIKEGDLIDVIDMSQSSKQDESLKDAIIIVEEEEKEKKGGSESAIGETIMLEKDRNDEGFSEMPKSNDILNGERRIKDVAKSRKKRSEESDQELDDILQNLENAEVAEIAHIDGDWTNTPCAKRIFCDTMIQRGTDASIFMEKKMAALLALIQPDAAVQVSNHFQEVMDAVRRHDCSSFFCPQARPGNVFF